MRANNARVEFDKTHNRWEVHIYVGAEVIKRPITKTEAESGEAALKTLAIQTAKDEGYDVDPASVSVVQ
jgi:hypothetical protein